MARGVRQLQSRSDPSDSQHRAEFHKADLPPDGRDQRRRRQDQQQPASAAQGLCTHGIHCDARSARVPRHDKRKRCKPGKRRAEADEMSQLGNTKSSIVPPRRSSHVTLLSSRNAVKSDNICNRRASSDGRFCRSPTISEPATSGWIGDRQLFHPIVVCRPLLRPVWSVLQPQPPFSEAGLPAARVFTAASALACASRMQPRSRRLLRGRLSTASLLHTTLATR